MSELTITRPAAGEFRVARLEGVLSRLVLVIGRIDEQHSTVALVTNEVECSSARDVRLDPAETGLPYAVSLETDLCGPVADRQLGPLLGRLASPFSDLARPLPDLSAFGGRVGLPLLRRTDGRWCWKQQELGELQRLCAPAFIFLVDGAEGGGTAP